MDVIKNNVACLLLSYKDGEYYNFPGGAVEPGETLAECARREVMEETGLTVDVGEALFTLEVETHRHGIAQDPHLSVFFACAVDETAPQINPTHPDHSPDGDPRLAQGWWVPLEQLRELHFLPYVPDNILDYARTGNFEPRFLSGHFEKA